MGGGARVRARGGAEPSRAPPPRGISCALRQRRSTSRSGLGVPRGAGDPAPPHASRCRPGGHDARGTADHDRRHARSSTSPAAASAHAVSRPWSTAPSSSTWWTSPSSGRCAAPDAADPHSLNAVLSRYQAGPVDTRSRLEELVLDLCDELAPAATAGEHRHRRRRSRFLLAPLRGSSWRPTPTRGTVLRRRLDEDRSPRRAARPRGLARAPLHLGAGDAACADTSDPTLLRALGTR